MFKKEENTRKLLFLKKKAVCFFALFQPLFVCIICVGTFILRVLVPRRAFVFLAGLRGANESISGKHVDFCFHGDPEGLTMSPRLRPAGWWKTLLPFSLFYSHFVPPFVLNSPSSPLFVELFIFRSSSPTSLPLCRLFASNVCCFASFEVTLTARCLRRFSRAVCLTFSILLAAFLPLLSSACEEL